MPPPAATSIAAVASAPDPTMFLQPHTSRTDSVLPPLGSDSCSNSRQREPIQVKPRATGLGLPAIDSPADSPALYSQPPPATSTRVRRPATALYLPQSQQSLSQLTRPTPTTFPTPTTTPYVDWRTRSFTPPEFSPLGPLTPQSPYSIPVPPTQLSTTHYPPGRFSVTPGGAPPSIPEEDPEKELEKVLRAVSRPAYLMLRCVLIHSVQSKPYSILHYDQ